MKKRWNERTKLEKSLAISRTLVSLILLYASSMKLLNVWPKGLNVAIPLCDIYLILETIYNWKIDKDKAAFYFLMAIIATTISCAVFISYHARVIGFYKTTAFQFLSRIVQVMGSALFRIFTTLSL